MFLKTSSAISKDIYPATMAAETAAVAGKLAEARDTGILGKL